MTVKSSPRERSVYRALLETFGESDAPLSAMLELADRCNEVCVHCYQVQGTKGEMSTAEVERLLDDLARMGILFVTLSGGEVTLRADFLDIVRAARERRFAVKIYTNGLTMTAALAQALADLAVQEVQISLYSPRPEVHDWITRVPGSFDRTVAGIRHLAERRVPVIVKTPLMIVNVDDRRAWVELVESLGVDHQVDPSIEPREGGDRSPEALRLTDSQYRELLGEPALGLGMDSPPPSGPDPERRPCGACASVHVEANGELRPCNLLEVPLGNARERPVDELFRDHPVARDLRSFRWRDLHGCRDCDLARYCGRCYAHAKVDGGDAFGPYAAACRRARIQWEHAHGRRLRTEELGANGEPPVGPYRVEDATLSLRPHIQTDHDRALAERHPWARGAGPISPVSVVAPGELVQIRRPGRRPSVERVPAVVGGPPDEPVARSADERSEPAS